MTNETTYRGVTVEYLRPSGFYCAYLDSGRIRTDDLDGALAEVDRQQGPYPLTVTLDITVDPDGWMDAYGTPRQNVAADAREALRYTIRQLVEQEFARHPRGATVTSAEAVERDTDTDTDTDE